MSSDPFLVACHAVVGSEESDRFLETHRCVAGLEDKTVYAQNVWRLQYNACSFVLYKKAQLTPRLARDSASHLAIKFEVG